MITIARIAATVAALGWISSTGAEAPKAPVGPSANSPAAQRAPFTATDWIVEQMPGGKVTIDAGKLIIEDAEGCTVWWRTMLRAPVRISYDATVISAGGTHDRVSDLNCFWMAKDATGAAPYASAQRHGRFADYDSLETYYVGYGGNSNTTTRFRRYGAGKRPLRPEDDLRQRQFLLEPNRKYHIELVAADGEAEFYRDGEKVFSFPDPQPLTFGWFGLRTVHSHIVVENFKVAMEPRRLPDAKSIREPTP
jgi:hypothetical protein